MSRPRPESDAASPVDGVSLAIASEIRETLIGELSVGTPSLGEPHSYDALTDEYSVRLFGALAAHLVGMEVAPNDNPTERAKTTVEALRRIGTNASLFEQIIGVPYSAELGNQVSPKLLSAEVGAQPKEALLAESLRETLCEKGYIGPHNIPIGQPIELIYKARQPKRNKLGIVPKTPVDARITVTTQDTAVVNNFYETYYLGLGKYDRHFHSREEFTARVYRLIATNDVPRKPDDISDRIGRMIYLPPLAKSAVLTVSTPDLVCEPKSHRDRTTPKTLNLKNYSFLDYNLTHIYVGTDQRYPVLEPSES